MVTVGAMEGLMLTMMLLLDPGDEIMVPDPCFPNYYGQASLTGACAKPVPTYEENDYRMMAADIERCITPHTKALLLNSPCNPTGAVLTKEDILAIAEALKSTECVEQMVADYTRRREILIDGINAIPGFSCRKSAGSFYAFASSDENLKEAVRRIDAYVRKTYPDMK